LWFAIPTATIELKAGPTATIKIQNSLTATIEFKVSPKETSNLKPDNSKERIYSSIATTIEFTALQLDRNNHQL
jgi:hypothetical protein